jgi:hypothetical protein
MATDVKLKPGWLTRDVAQATKRVSEWRSSGKDRHTETGSNGKSDQNQTPTDSANKPRGKVK